MPVVFRRTRRRPARLPKPIIEFRKPDKNDKTDKKKAPKADSEESLWERTFFEVLKRETENLPERQYQFCRWRKFRADFAWPKERVIVEIDGGVFSGGRHVTGPGFTRDCEKLTIAAGLGFRVIRFTGEMVRFSPIECVKYTLLVLTGSDEKTLQRAMERIVCRKRY